MQTLGTPYPATLTFDAPERIANWRPLVNWLLAIPHLIALAFLGMAVYVLIFIGFFAVLFTGRWPAGIRDFGIGVGRWFLRANAYLLLLTDEYPPFTTD